MLRRLLVCGAVLSALFVAPSSGDPHSAAKVGALRCEGAWIDDVATKIEIVKPGGAGRRQIPLPGEGSHARWIPAKNAAQACK
jgi:hypothetical protein